MRTLLAVVGIVAAALVLLGLLLEAARWLLVIGAVALLAVLVLVVVKSRRVVSRPH
jgi:O-antigen/teichoic acid export membrane protein